MARNTFPKTTAVVSGSGPLSEEGASPELASGNMDAIGERTIDALDKDNADTQGIAESGADA